jgi:hypothetical protein
MQPFFSRFCFPWQRAVGVRRIHLGRLVPLIAIALILAARPAAAQTELPCTPGPHTTNIGADQLWCAADNPHLVNGTITVMSGVTLTIQAGAQVRFAASAGINIDGNLLANGASGQLITFTSNEATHTPGYWRSLQFASAAGGQITYADIGYGGGGAWSMLEVYSSNLLVENVAIHDNTGTSGAVRLLTGGMTPTFRNVQISNNTGYPIHQSTADMAPTYEGLAFSSNTNDAIYLNGGTINRNLTYDGRQLSGSPFIANSTLAINSGYTLTIQPGTTLKLGSSASLVVYANAGLSAIGEAGQPIVITALTPGSNFAAVHISANATVSLAYCDISRAAGVQGTLMISSSNVLIDHCNLHDNSPGNGVIYLGYIGASGLTPVVQNTTIANNAGYPIYHYSFDIAPTYTNLSISGNGMQAVFLGSGAYNRNVTLDNRELSGIPFVVSGSITVASGNTLTIAPGSELRFPQAGGGGTGLFVQSAASLLAEGTSAEPITFTAESDSARYSGIFFSAGSTASLAWCDVSHAANSQGVLAIGSSNVHVNHCVIHDNAPSVGAIWLSAAGISPTIENTLIQRNTGYAVALNNLDAAPSLLNLTFDANGTDAVYLPGGTLNRNATLDSRQLGGKPYLAGGSIAVAAPNTLTISPGTTLRLPQSGGGGSGLIVQNGATLLAEGTPAEPITLSAWPDGTRFSTHTFQAGSTARLAYCDISRGGGVQGVLSISSSAVTVDHCNIHDNTPTVGAIWLAASGITPAIRNTGFQGNSGHVVYFNNPDMAPVLENLAASGNTYNAIGIGGGTISTGRSWSIGKSSLPAHIQSGIAVSAGGFLSLDPGTVLKFDSSASLAISGGFFALGTTLLPIQVGGLSNTPGSWRGIVWNAGSKAILDNVELAHGGNGQPILRIGTSDFSMQNSWVHHSSNDGIQVINNSTQPVLHYNRIEDNAGYGLNNLTGNHVTVDATFNWWGHASGPYHASNPAGQGDDVSNYVAFSPWLTSPQKIGDLPIGKVYVDLVSQTRASPGQRVSFAIWYNNLSTEVVTDTVLVLNLPNTVYYRSSSAGGTYWPARRQVFWKLGTLNPGSSGAVAVDGSYRWGVPDLTLEAGMAIMLGSGLQNGQLLPADYLAYQPYTVTAKQTLTESQFNAGLPALPDLNTLFTQAQAAGFLKGSYNRQTMSNGDLYTQAVLLRPDLSEIQFVTGSNLGAVSYVIGRSYMFLITPTDTVLYNLQTNTIEIPHLPGALEGPILGNNDRVNCLVNCLILETGTALLSEFAPLLGKIGTISDCTAFLADPSNSEALASCAAGIQTTIPGAGTIVSAVNCYNRSLANPDHCKCSSSLWEGTTMPFTKTEACKKTPCVDGVFAPYDQAVYPCATCTKCVSGSGGSDDPASHCKPTGATPPAECKTAGQPTAGVFLESPTGQDDDIFDGMKICVLIPRDPNAKYGQAGELVPGQQVTYQVTYENEGAGTAYGVYVTDVLDASYDDSTLVLGSNAIYVPASRQIIWTIGELAPKGQPGSQGEVSFSVRLKDGLPGGSPVFNQALVYFPSVPEITPTNAVVNYIQEITALPQSLETSYMTPVAITLQGEDVGGGGLTFAVVTPHLFGALTGTPPDLTYTPAANITGQDAFTYTAGNGVSTSDPAEVTITIHPAANDTQPPSIRWSDPANQASGIAFRSTPVMSDTLGNIYAPYITIQFSEAIDLDTLTAANLRLADSTGHTLNTTVFYDELGNQAVIYPREVLQNNQWYTVTVKGGVTDQAGNPMGSDYTFTFRVGYAVDQDYLFLPLMRR